MKKKYFIIISLLFVVIFETTRCHSSQTEDHVKTDTITSNNYKINTPKTTKVDSLPLGLIKLQQAYPDFIDSICIDFLVWKDGTKMIYDDGKIKTNFDTLLNTADLQDQMEMKYVKGKNFDIPHKNFDPGRVRNEDFFRKMYGNSSQEAAKNLVTISWLPNSVNKKLRVTSINGVDKKLVAISAELEKLPHLKKYLDNPGGTFYWRVISGTNRLSMHSFGIAIDINVNHSNYWRWSGQQNADSIPYKNKIPLEIVTIFEKYGFIWGGKWYHYDTMHFEYRPELID